jgi:cobalamin-dependent methionine synthase I
VCTTPTGHRHEFGALLAAVVAAQSGWRSTYLGPDLPAEEIAATVLRLGGNAVALSAVFPIDDPHLCAQVFRLKSLLPPGTPVFIGGAAANRNHEELVDGGVVLIQRLPELRQHLTSGIPAAHPVSAPLNGERP